MSDQDMIHAVQQGPVAVRVKPLEWKWYRDPKDTSEARTQIGSWTVWEINGSAYCHGPNDTCGRPCAGGLDGAKAAAQADYEARILAAIEPTTDDALAQARLDGWAAAIEAAARLCDDTARDALDTSGEFSRKTSQWFRAQATAIRTLTLAPPSDLAPLLAARDKRVREQALREAAAEAAGEVAAHGLAEIAPFLRRSILALNTPESRAIAEGNMK